MSKDISNRIGLYLALLASLQFIAGSTALPGLVPAHIAQWVQLIVGAIDAGVALYIARSSNVEWWKNER
jgi:hypothetical protein